MHFIYDRTTNRTIAVAKADIEPDAVIPSSEDPVSIRLQWEAIMAGHDLKSYPIPDTAYAEALALFHKAEEHVLHLDRFDARAMNKARARREEFRKERERRRARGITQAMRADVVERHGKGQKVSYIAQKVEIGTTSVNRILQAANDEKSASDAA